VAQLNLATNSVLYTTSSTASPTAPAANPVGHPFGLCLANQTTLYVADEGSGSATDFTTALQITQFSTLRRWDRFIAGSRGRGVAVAPVPAAIWFSRPVRRGPDQDSKPAPRQFLLQTPRTAPFGAFSYRQLPIFPAWSVR
jgi:hypothetical protein